MANNFPTIKPSLNLQFANTGILPPDVTFTRASQSGGYYDGKTVVKAEENLLLYSQEFDNAYWAKGAGVTLTANAAAAPDGTLTAEKISTAGTADNSVNRISRVVSGSAGTYSLSISLRAAVAQTVRLKLLENNGATVTETLDASVTTTWTRFEIVATTATALPAITIGPDGVTALTDVEIWGAQLEQRDAVTAYTPTTTQPITRFQPKLEYAIANEPVFDHNPVTGEALGLSIFEARTNLLLRSEEFDDAFWTKINSTIEANQIIAPDGTLTADKLVEDTANGQHLVRRAVGVSSGSAFTFSCYVKKSEIETVFIGQTASGGAGISTRTAEINLTDGTITSQTIAGSSRVVNAGNGWYRISLTSATTTGSGAPSFIIGLRQLTSYTGDGVSGIYIWGAQLEAGAFATPYIPTVASTVTRSADAAVMTGANFSRWYRADEGAFVAEFNSVNVSAFGIVIQVDDGSNINRHVLFKTFESGSSRLKAVTITNSASQTDLNLKTTGVIAGQFYKSSYAYKTNDFAGSADGGAIVTDTSGIVGAATQIGIGVRQPNNDFRLNGYIKSLQYYPARLTNDNLVAVTQ